VETWDTNPFEHKNKMIKRTLHAPVTNFILMFFTFYVCKPPIKVSSNEIEQTETVHFIAKCLYMNYHLVLTFWSFFEIVASLWWNPWTLEFLKRWSANCDLHGLQDNECKPIMDLAEVDNYVLHDLHWNSEMRNCNECYLKTIPHTRTLGMLILVLFPHSPSINTCSY